MVNGLLNPTSSASTPAPMHVAVDITESQLLKSPASATEVDVADSKKDHVVLTVDAYTMSPSSVITTCQDDSTDLKMGGSSMENEPFLVYLYQAVSTFCIGWAIGQAFLPEESRLKYPLYKSVTIAVIVAFGSLLLSGFLSVSRRRCPPMAYAFKAVGILSGVTAFFMGASIHLISSPHTCKGH